ncbi:MAG TPA: hypothetical protein DEG88_00300 [Propionibacteriaceae bacterium]|nr:hypothetical protein [Propionibacteriaceae bacterium]HBY21777.1 hypothetical protein [Propionibacteriaceae bacterium]
MDVLRVDCGTCRVRGPACRDCVISLLLGVPQEVTELEHDERRALAALAGSGLMPPLRLVPPLSSEQLEPRSSEAFPESGVEIQLLSS